MLLSLPKSHPFLQSPYRLELLLIYLLSSLSISFSLLFIPSHHSTTSVDALFSQFYILSVEKSHNLTPPPTTPPPLTTPTHYPFIVEPIKVGQAIV